MPVLQLADGGRSDFRRIKNARRSARIVETDLSLSITSGAAYHRRNAFAEAVVHIDRRRTEERIISPNRRRTKAPDAMETLGPQHSRRLAFFIVGAFVVAAIVLVVLNVGDITDFMEQSARADPRWLAAAVASQLMTYACVVLVWRRVLKSMGFSLGFLRLYPLAIAKMFSDQAVPSGGVAGAAFLFRALGRRGVPYANAFTVFSFTAVTFFAAFLLAASISLAAIATVDDASPALSTSIAAFAAAVSILVLAVSAIAL
ncbi:MAG: lysylphosphatidylglycerol synthase transmembrane domain-containing protein, partial [Planctomycetota bacterium]